MLYFLLIINCLALQCLSGSWKHHVYPSQDTMIFWRSVWGRRSMSVASIPASVTLHLLLLPMHALSAHTPHFRETGEPFSHCHHYFLLFSDKKDNHGFLKYLFVQLSINLATPLALDIFFFITHNAFLCHIFRQWGKISWYYHIL